MFVQGFNVLFQLTHTGSVIVLYGTLLNSNEMYSGTLRTGYARAIGGSRARHINQYV